MIPEVHQAVCARIAHHCGVTIGEVLSPSRLAPTVKARRLVARWLRLHGASSTAIGRAIGRDHSTVLRLLDCEQCGQKIEPTFNHALACATCGAPYWAPAAHVVELFGRYARRVA